MGKLSYLTVGEEGKKLLLGGQGMKKEIINLM